MAGVLIAADDFSHLNAASTAVDDRGYNSLSTLGMALAAPVIQHDAMKP